MAANRKSKIDFDGFEAEIDPEISAADKEEIKGTVLRRSFRIPAEQTDPIQVRMQSEFFDVLNISETGIQVLLQREDEFQTGQTIDPVEVFFSKTSLSLMGKVTYVSQIDFDQFALGLELSFPTQTARRKFRKYYLENFDNVIKKISKINIVKRIEFHDKRKRHFRRSS
jgi:hypothetical protein